jgi:uncharacterized protein (TIGR02996 family)
MAHHDDDTARLVFADWLEEHGDDARAELIRVQIERARLPEWDARQVRLRLRESELIERHGKKWKRELPKIKGMGWGEFRRGFVATATFSKFSALQASAGACWAAAPIEAVTVRWPRQTDHVESIAPIAGLRELSINARVVDYREVERLAEAPLLSTLRALNLRSCNLGVAGLGRLVASPHLGELRALRAPFNSVGNGGISALYDASLTSLEELDLSETGSYGRYGEDPIIEATGLQALAGWSGMARLCSLRLSGNDVRRGGLRALLRSKHATGLKELALRGNGLTGQAMQELGAARAGLQLDVLDLGENLLREVGAAYLARAPCLRELKALALDRCEMEVSAARELARAPFLDSLRRLNVNHNSFGLEGLRALLDKKPPSLHTLELANNDLGDEAGSRLAESPASDTLLEVNLALNELGGPAAKALAESNHLQNLLVLWLGDNPIDKSAAAALTRSPLGKRLAIFKWQDPDDIPF